MGQLKLVIQTPEPVRLCEYLRRRIGVSARLLARLKRTPAGILCNGVPVRAVDPVRAGDVVVLTMPEPEGLEPNPALYVPSVLETAHYIVYDKPTGMPVHPSARHRRDTLGNYFAASMPGHTFRAVNRLDRDTSGLCMIAKDAYTATHCPDGGVHHYPMCPAGWETGGDPLPGAGAFGGLHGGGDPAGNRQDPSDPGAFCPSGLSPGRG